MGNGYTRQEAANIVNGNTANATHVSNELNAVQSAFDNSSGHDHSGAANGAPIPTAGIVDEAITYAKIQNVSSNNVLLGNDDGAGSTLQELSASDVKTLLSLNNVENTALSTWTGSANITTLGTIGTGTWQGDAINATYVGDLPTSKITSGTFADARISESSVTQHEAALTITESQISDLGTYETADADILKADTADTLTAGFKATSYDNGTKSTGTFTPDADNGNIQHYTNNGAHTLAAPDGPTTMVLEIVNDSSAGTVTLANFDAEYGINMVTTDGNVYQANILVTNTKKSITILGPM